MSNRLANETSPYLLQHKDNPVDWYPWCAEAFARAAKEDKPVFLSIGYSACHWCHVLAHESFEDPEIAELLNQYFISVKVDKEERPDIDSVYMAVCQAFTGSGGWPTSIFLTADQKPFFAGTYYPKTSRHGMIGMRELLTVIHEKWTEERESLLQQSELVLRHLQKPESTAAPDFDPIPLAVQKYKRLYDEKHGGFGRAPKFPTPHNLLFLLSFYERFGDKTCLRMAEHTLLQMYRGGLFDHIGFGFCRYSTDSRFLVPHFEKMLYDNALLILAYCKVYAVTGKALYLRIAEKTADYILREMVSPDGGFYSSQDADSEGEEGKYYLFTPKEVIDCLGKHVGKSFNRHYDITEQGNFEGKSIPNLLNSDPVNSSFEACLPKLREYRKQRYALHRDEKILTSWNGLMIAALCALYLLSRDTRYLDAAKRADAFVETHLYDGDALFVSFHGQKRGVLGFLDDYAACIYAQLALYKATLEEKYLSWAKVLCDQAVSDFADGTEGFYLYSDRHEELILRPKGTYDGAIPSGNSLMSCNLVRLSILTGEEKYRTAAENQLDFLSKTAAQYPTGYAMFLTASLEYTIPPMQVTVVPDPQTDIGQLPLTLPPDTVIRLVEEPTEEYKLLNGKTTYYVCKGQSCQPPTNDLGHISR